MTEHEELLILRILAEKYQLELAEKDQTIEAQKTQIENMIQALLHTRKKLFGSSTEATKAVDDQLSLFETAQELAEELKQKNRRIYHSGNRYLHSMRK